MMEGQLSDRQREMFAFIEAFVEENGYPPTYEEIRVALGISTKSLVHHHMDALEGAGYLARMPNTPRGIRLLRSKTLHVPKTFRVPKLGRIAAGVPISVGDYVLVHAGFAIQKLDSEDAQERLDLIKKALLG